MLRNNRPEWLYSTFVVFLFRQRLYAGHEDVVVPQKLVEQEAAERIAETLVLQGICQQYIKTSIENVQEFL